MVCLSEGGGRDDGGAAVGCFFFVDLWMLFLEGFMPEY